MQEPGVGDPFAFGWGDLAGAGLSANALRRWKPRGVPLPRGTALLPKGVALRVIAPLDC